MSENKVLYFRTRNAEETIEELMCLPNVEADIVGGLEYYSKASGELRDEHGQKVIWRVSLTVPGKPTSPGLIEIEYAEAGESHNKPSTWVMHLVFEALDTVEAELISREEHVDLESV